MDNAEGNPANGTAWVQAPSAKCADFKNVLAVDLDPGASKKEQVANHDKGHCQRDQPD